MQSTELKVSQEASIDASEQSGGELTEANEETLKANSNLKSKFSTRFDGILTVIEETRRDLAECTKRLTQNGLVFFLGSLSSVHVLVLKCVYPLRQSSFIKGSSWSQRWGLFRIAENTGWGGRRARGRGGVADMPVCFGVPAGVDSLAVIRFCTLLLQDATFSMAQLLTSS